MNKFNEKFIQKMGLDESYRSEYAQAIYYDKADDQKNAGELYYLAGKIAQEEANTWHDIARDMDFNECRRIIINLCSFFYAKSSDFFLKSYISNCYYGTSKENPWIMGRLANLYMEGKDLPQDYAKALSLYTQAAKKGDIQSMRELGRCLFEGLGVEKNLVEAFKWLIINLEKGFKSSIISVIFIRIFSNQIKKKLFIFYLTQLKKVLLKL